MAAEGFLPPVVAILTSNTTEFNAGMDSAILKEAELGSAFDRLIVKSDMMSLSLAKIASASDTAAAKNALAMEKMSADTTAASAKMELAAAKAEASNKALGDSALATTAKMDAANAAGTATVTAFGVAAAAVAVGSVVLADKFQVQMTRLYTAAGAPKQVVLDSYDAVLKIANDVGQTGTAMAEALYHPISAGLDMATALNVVKYSAQEARISGASLDDTTYSLSSVMKAFNQSAADAGPTMATLNAIVGQGDMRFQDFNQSVKNWAPTAAQMGISITSMGAGLAYLTDRGNSAEVAATRMTMGITMMSTPTKAAGKILEGLGVASADVTASSDLMTATLKKAGITNNQLAVDLQKPDGLYVALSHLKDSLTAAGVSGTEADSTLSKIFGGGRSDKAIMSLMQNLDGLKTKYEDIAKASTPEQFAQNWADASSTFSGTMHQLLAVLENLGIMIGSKILPVLTTIAQWFIGSISWLMSHKEALIAIASGAIPVLVAGLVLLTAWTWSLAAALWATGIPELILIFMALGLAVYELVTHWSAIAGFFADVWNAVWKWCSDIITKITTFISDVFNGNVENIKNAWGAISGFFADIWNAVWRWFSDRITDIVGFVSGVFNGTVDAIKSVWNGIPGFFSNLWKNVLSFFTDLPGKIGFALGYAIGTVIKWGVELGQALRHGIDNMMKWFSELPANVGKWWVRLKDDALLWGAKILIGLADGISSGWNNLMQWFHDLPGNISHWWGQMKDEALQWGGEILNNLGVGIKKQWDTLMQWFHDLPGNVSRWWTQMKDDALAWGGNILYSLWDGLRNAWNAVIDWFYQLPGVLGRFFAGAGDWLVSAGQNLVIGIWNGIQSLAGWLWNQVVSFAHGIVDGIKSALGIHSPSIHTHEMGQNLVVGLANGIDANAALAAKATQGMVDRVLGVGAQLSTGKILVNGSLSGNAGGGQSMAATGAQQMNFTMQMNPRDVQTFLQTGTLKYNLRNTSNGQTTNKRLVQ